MASLETMLIDTRAAAAQATDSQVLRALRHAAVEFCAATHIWTETLDPIPAESGTAVYDFGTPNGSRVEKVLGFKFDGRLIDNQARPREFFTLDAAPGSPTCFAIELTTQQFMVWPTPGAAEVGDFSLHVVLVPTEAATSLPDSLIQSYRSGLIAYAKAELLALSPEMPWYNPQNAMMQRELGDQIAARAKRTQLSGGNMQLRVRPRPFA